MTIEGTENRFRERRSAYRDDSVETSETTVGEAAPVGAPVDESPAREPETELQEPRLEEEPDFEEMAQLDLPEPSFNEIVYEYAIRAQQFLGETPLMPEGHHHVLPNYAKHMIDLLGILEDRTRGNLTPEESQLLEQILADLRLRYVSHTT